MSDSSPRSFDERLMTRALELAGAGDTAPNPHVGAVVVQGEEIVGSGYHERAGGPHAEVMALREAGPRARGGTLYCTLEPCNHHGRTPPCTDAIIAAGIQRVVIGCRDPAKHDSLTGIPRLEQAGIEVVVGVLEQRSLEMIEDFHILVTRGRPLVELKAAITLDGRIATRTGDSKWITGPEARTEAHRMRARADAILVGAGTVIADDPKLDVRMVSGRDPVRIVLDTHLRVPLTSKVIRHDSTQPTLIVHGPGVMVPASIPGVEWVELPIESGKIQLGSLLDELGRRKMMRLLVEGGAQIHGALLDQGLVDRCTFFIAPRILGDSDALPFARRATAVSKIADALQLEQVEVDRIGPDIRVRGRVASRARLVSDE